MKNSDLTLLEKACGLEGRLIMDYSGGIIQIKNEDLFSQLRSNLDDDLSILMSLRKLVCDEKNRTDFPVTNQENCAIIESINHFE